MNRHPNVLRLLAVLLGLALVGAACGSDDDEGDGASATSTSVAADGGRVEGCGDGASTDPEDTSPGRQVARCDAGAPAPRPLPERQTVRMSSAFKAEFVAPILLADHFGEFDKENLDFEFVELGFSDAISQIASKQIDVAVGGTEAALFNAVHNGVGIKWGMGNFFPPDAGDEAVPQTGLWVRNDAFENPDDPDLAELKGTKIASAVGKGSSIAYPIAVAFEDAGLSLNDLEFVQVPSPEMVTALRNDAVQSAWLLDPYWIQASESPDLRLVATQPPGEPIGGLYFGEHMFGEDREKALAFVRAVIRTINTYLDGDYQADDEVMQALAEETGTTVEALASTPALVFDWEIRAETASRAQGYFIEFDVVEYDEPMPEDDVVDRSLYLEAVGAAG